MLSRRVEIDGEIEAMGIPYPCDVYKFLIFRYPISELIYNRNGSFLLGNELGFGLKGDAFQLCPRIHDGDHVISNWFVEHIGWGMRRECKIPMDKGDEGIMLKHAKHDLLYISKTIKASYQMIPRHQYIKLKTKT